MRYIIAAILLTGSVGLCVSAFGAEEEEKKPKMTIKEVMKLHKEKLHEKFQDGSATKEEKEKLLKAYEALALNKPPKGDIDAWKKRTAALVKSVKEGDKDGFKKAVNCADCHKDHKGP